MMLDVLMSAIEELKFCPVCKANLLKEEIGGEPRMACSSMTCSYVYWNNPTPVLAAIAHRENEVVLVQGIGWPGHWFSLVTGFHEAGESAEEGTLREVKEELGLDGEIGSLVGVYSYFQMNQVIIAYDVVVEEGDITLDLTELVDYKIVKIKDVRPWPSGTGHAIKDWLYQQGITNEELSFRKK